MYPNENSATCGSATSVISTQSSSEIAFSELAWNQRALEDVIDSLAERLSPALHPQQPTKDPGPGNSYPAADVPLCAAIWLANDRAIQQRERLLGLLNRLAI